jgi:predicted nucleotidyltransferase
MTPSEVDKILALAKAIIAEEVEKAGYHLERVLLFGSRARGDFRSDSDWDFYVIVEEEIAPSNRREVVKNIRRKFIRAGFSGDVFIHSKKTVETRKDNTGFLTYYVFQEGKEI